MKNTALKIKEHFLTSQAEALARTLTCERCVRGVGFACDRPPQLNTTAQAVTSNIPHPTHLSPPTASKIATRSLRPRNIHKAINLRTYPLPRYAETPIVQTGGHAPRFVPFLGAGSPMQLSHVKPSQGPPPLPQRQKPGVR
jgi:hypothetical protein